MDSNGSISRLTARAMPFTAILLHDLRTLWSSWLVRVWLAATALVAMFQILSGWEQFRSGPLIASILFPYLVLPWSLVVMMLSVNPLSGARSGVAADAILSRPVSRHTYLLAAWTARVSLVLSVYLAVTIPAIAIVALADRPPAADKITLYGVVASLAVVGLVLTFLVSIGFLLGTMLRTSLLPIVILVFLWFPVNLVLNVFSLEEFSPISLTQALPTLLRQTWREVDYEVPIEELDSTLEDAMRFFGSLAGNSAPQDNSERGFFERDEEYKDFSVRRVSLGYGAPTVVALVLATMLFSFRDV